MTQSATSQPQLAPLSQQETIYRTGAAPATHDAPAFKGRVIFHVRYSTLADVSAARQMFKAFAASEDFDKDLTDDAAETAQILLSTSAITFRTPTDHPEIEDLRQFWIWYTNGKNHNLGYVWQRRLMLGWAVVDQWIKAKNSASATSLPAPIELQPDEALTEEQRQDPFSESGERPPDDKSGTSSQRSPKAKSVGTASTKKSKTGVSAGTQTT